MAGADTPNIRFPVVDFQPGRHPEMECHPVPTKPTTRDLLAEAAEARKRGDLAAAACAELDAARLARAACAGGGE
jgi:hypothetical protein